MVKPQGQFDPYHKWLGIPAKHQPPTHYRLLGIEVFESEPEVINSAAHRQTAYIRLVPRASIPNWPAEFLATIAVARLCLLDPEQKGAYDSQLTKDIPTRSRITLPTH